MQDRRMRTCSGSTPMRLYVVGLVEVVRHLPNIRRCGLGDLVKPMPRERQARCRHPDRFPRLQSPALARELHRLGIPVFYFVSPRKYGRPAHGTRKADQEICPQDDCDLPLSNRSFTDGTMWRSAMLAIRWRMWLRRKFHARNLPAGTVLIRKRQWIALLPGSWRKRKSG